MTHTTEIAKLLKAKTRIERKLKELDQRIEHVRWRLDEERRCMARKCQLDDADDDLQEYL
jgi:hypothetical protein